MTSAAEYALALDAEEWGRLGALQLTLRERLPHHFEIVVSYHAEITILIKVIFPWKSGPVPLEQLSAHVAKSPIPALDEVVHKAWSEYGVRGFEIGTELTGAAPDDHSLRCYVIARGKKTDLPKGNN